MALRSTKRGRFHIFENLGEVTKDELETLRAETRRLAKVANQRLVRLEKESEFGVSPAYKRAREDLRSGSGAPRRRYRENVKTASRQELIDEYRSLREFVTAKSSTVAGYEKIVKDRYQAFLEREGLTESDMSIQEYVEGWEKVTAGFKKKELYYRSQFKLLKVASERWKAEKAAAAEAGKDPQGSFQDVLADTIKEWKGKTFIQTLRQEHTEGES